MHDVEESAEQTGLAAWMEISAEGRPFIYPSSSLINIVPYILRKGIFSLTFACSQSV